MQRADTLQLENRRLQTDKEFLQRRVESLQAEEQKVPESTCQLCSFFLCSVPALRSFCVCVCRICSSGNSAVSRLWGRRSIRPSRRR